MSERVTTRASGTPWRPRFVVFREFIDAHTEIADMNSSPIDVIENHGISLIEQALRGVVGHAAELLMDDDHYRAFVIDAAWALMPMPVRIVGRTRLRWDDVFLALRDEVFEVRGSTVSIRVDLGARISLVLGRILGGDGASQGDDDLRVDDGWEDRAADAVAAVDPGPRAVEPRLAVGIDLGTTFSVIAHLDAAGRAWTIANAEGDLTTPSVVLFDGDSIVVGKEAVKAAALEPERVAQFAKRDMGDAVYSRPINGERPPPRPGRNDCSATPRTPSEP